MDINSKAQEKHPHLFQGAIAMARHEETDVWCFDPSSSKNYEWFKNPALATLPRGSRVGILSTPSTSMKFLPVFVVRVYGTHDGHAFSGWMYADDLMEEQYLDV